MTLDQQRWWEAGFDYGITHAHARDLPVEDRPPVAFRSWWKGGFYAARIRVTLWPGVRGLR